MCAILQIGGVEVTLPSRHSQKLPAGIEPESMSHTSGTGEMRMAFVTRQRGWKPIITPPTLRVAVAPRAPVPVRGWPRS